MADEIVIPPKVPVNPAGKPGVGGLAAIPGIIGTIVGADGFCSIYSFPSAGLCVGDPDVPIEERDEKTGYGSIPAWCLAWSDGPYCNVTPKSEPIILQNNVCFDVNWNKIPCSIENGKKYGYMYINDRFTYEPLSDYITCLDINDRPFHCDSVYFGIDKYPLSDHFYIGVNGNCYPSDYDSRVFTNPIPCRVDIDITALDVPFGSNGYALDKYSRIVNPKTFMPFNDDRFIEGYPKPQELEPEPEPEKPYVPYDPGPNPFNPTLPDVPEGEECAGLICECIALVTNALGAVDNSINAMKDNLSSLMKIMNDRLFSIDTALVAFLDYMELIIGDIDNPLGNGTSEILERILEAIDEISVEVVKEAGTNFWDVLGGAFGDIFDLIEFLIEKIIYLVIPENTAAISDAMDSMKSTLQGKVAPVHEIQQHITSAMNVEERSFENISVNLPKYGEVTFFKIDYLLLALPYIKMLMSASMILVTSIWAYRKISSEMVR